MSESKAIQTSCGLVVPSQALQEIATGVYPRISTLSQALAKMDEFVSNFHVYAADFKERRLFHTGVAVETMRQLVIHSDEKNLAILAQRIGPDLLANLRRDTAQLPYVQA